MKKQDIRLMQAAAEKVGEELLGRPVPPVGLRAESAPDWKEIARKIARRYPVTLSILANK